MAEGAAGSEAAEAGDEAVGVAVARVERRQTSMGRRPSVAMECWRAEGCGVEGGAVAEEGVRGDFVDREVVEGVHACAPLGEGTLCWVKAG